jgi:glycosyltransferase involved in cell wall biosynthesis
MRILHIEWSDGWGGQECRVLSEMVGMAQRGHHVVLATRAHAKIAAAAAAEGIPVIYFPLRRCTDLRSILHLARYLRRGRFDVVNTHSSVDSWIGGLAVKLAGTPVLVRTRHLNLPLKRSWLNFVHYLPDKLITCGENMRRQLADGCGFALDGMVSIPTGIDFDTFAPHPSQPLLLRQELGLAEDAFVVLMVGVIRGVKRHEVALRAMVLLISQCPHAQLVLAGDGPMRSDMERLALELGITTHVHFLGHRTDIPDLMAASDALLLTSRSEGVPQAVTQALGMKMPIVATNVGGLGELVENEKSGLLIPPEDPAAAATALARLEQDKEWARRLGEVGWAHVHIHFSLNAMIDKTEALLAELLQGKVGKAQ